MLERTTQDYIENNCEQKTCLNSSFWGKTSYFYTQNDRFMETASNFCSKYIVTDCDIQGMHWNFLNENISIAPALYICRLFFRATVLTFWFIHGFWNHISIFSFKVLHTCDGFCVPSISKIPQCGGHISHVPTTRALARHWQYQSLILSLDYWIHSSYCVEDMWWLWIRTRRTSKISEFIMML